jgi:signal transduction histidine kinase
MMRQESELLRSPLSEIAIGQDIAIGEHGIGRMCSGGAMAALVNSHDWSRTAMGPMSRWSKELCSVVQLVLSFPTPACLHWGVDGELVYNDAYRSILGLRHPAALGRPAHEVWHEIWAVVGPQIDAVLNHGATIHETRQVIPIERDGHMEDHTWDYAFIPVYRDGRVRGVLNTCMDVSAIALAMSERDRSAERLSEVFSATSDGVLCLDRDWTMTFLNERGAQMLAASGPLEGLNLWEAFPSILYVGSPYVEHYFRAMDERIAGEFEVFYGMPLNLWLHIEPRPVRDGIVLFFRDVTKQKQAIEVMRVNERLISAGRLAASLAHEINSPLESVTNLLYLARLDAEKAEQVEVLDEAERELGRIRVIAEQTLLFHKQSTLPLRMAGAALFETVISLYRGRSRNSSVSVSTRWRGDGTVSCFQGEIRQVLGNLVANGIDAMPEGGRLLLRSREGTDWKTGRHGLILTVADTGTGMDKATQARAFEAFFTTKGMAGTGLGLWISAEIVARHHSRLHIRSSSRAGHHGTVISLFLPIGSRPEAGTQIV